MPITSHEEVTTPSENTHPADGDGKHSPPSGIMARMPECAKDALSLGGGLDFGGWLGLGGGLGLG
jgi:hypothetical protein